MSCLATTGEMPGWRGVRAVTLSSDRDGRQGPASRITDGPAGLPPPAEPGLAVPSAPTTDVGPRRASSSVADDGYCTFFVQGLLFGIGVCEVQEIIRHQVMTPVPRAPGVIGGLINLRGQIVTAMEVRACFGFPPRPADSDPINVVIRTDGGHTSLLVDAIGDVIAVTGLVMEPPPETLQGALRPFIVGVYKLDGQLLHVLDAHALTTIEDR